MNPSKVSKKIKNQHSGSQNNYFWKKNLATRKTFCKSLIKKYKNVYISELVYIEKELFVIY